VDEVHPAQRLHCRRWHQFDGDPLRSASLYPLQMARLIRGLFLCGSAVEKRMKLRVVQTDLTCGRVIGGREGMQQKTATEVTMNEWAAGRGGRR